MRTWNLAPGVGALTIFCLAACGDDGVASTGTGTGTESSGGSTEGGTESTTSTSTTQPTTTDNSGSMSMSDSQTNTGSSTVDPTASTGSSTGGNLCGNGAVDAGEACDDGVNDGSYGGCEPGCAALGPFCGDAMMNGPEPCDDGNQVDDDACSNACAAAACGDGVVQMGAGEECDDMNMDDTDACVTGCKSASCGDSFVQAGVEACDDGVNDGSYGGCAMDCASLGPGCGDGVKNGPEPCDDANTDSKDGCLADCSQPPDCKTIKAFDAAATDGVYTLTVGNTTWQAYCDMTFDGGGWTLAAKTIPTDGWAYQSPRWTDNMVFNANMPALDHTSAKLATWNLVPFTEVLVGMESPITMMNPPTLKYLKLGLMANSLFALFSPGTYVASMGTKAGWQGLVPMNSIQANCNQEGVNNAPAGNMNGRVRLGILGNNQNDCMSPDSAIGLGFGNFACMNNPFISVGNLNCEPNPPVKRTGMGYIFVR